MGRLGLSLRQIWFVLVALTAASVLTGEWGLAGALSGYIVIASAAVKARWILLDYMEARHAPGPWRYLFEGWLAGAALIMGILVAAS